MEKKMGNIRESRPDMRSFGGRDRAGLQGAGQGRRLRGKILVCFALAWVSILLDTFFLLQLRSQMKELQTAFGQIQGRLAVIEGDQTLTGGESEGLTVHPETVSGIDESSAVIDYVDLWGLDQVDKPKERTFYEILRRLEELGKDSDPIAQVTESYQYYPERLLEALANNPEIADFAVHYLENKGTALGGGLSENEREQAYPLFLQWDPRWGYASYGDESVVGLSGCGPTALSMVLYYLTGNEELTPDVIAEYSMQEGYYMSGTGTAWQLLEDVPPIYGISVSQPQKNERVMRQALDRGELVICSMGPGDFTVGGHFVVVYGYTEDGFLLNDPNCVARSRKNWPYSQIGGQIKHIWTFAK